MSFNSLQFALFLVVVLAGHLVLQGGARNRASRLWLLASSWFFYAAWSPLYLLFLLLSTTVDWALALGMARSRSRAARRVLLGLSLVSNLGILGWFKYGTLLAESALGLLALVGVGGDLSPRPLDLLLPVGISFYTFQSLSYSIDVYRGTIVARRSFLDVALYVAFFPQLVAGPIVRATKFLPQLDRPSRASERLIEQSLFRIAVGLAKKVLLADPLGVAVDAAFAEPSSIGVVGAMLAVYGFAFQIYFDFSGYSDIAIGTARLFGFEIPENFDRPYLASSPRDFWRRWHISLSTWLRDYLYIPLGGNKGSESATRVNLFMTMALGGLWHGASWMFLLWGAWHGGLLIAQRALASRGSGLARLPLGLRRVLTFHLVCVGWLIFRAETPGQFRAMLQAFRRSDTGFAPHLPAALVLLVVAVGLHQMAAREMWSDRFLQLSPSLQGVLYAGTIAVLWLAAPAAEQFIYFQF